MKRWWLMVGLLLSVGFNLGLLAAAVGGWWGWGDDRAADAPVPPGVVASAGAGDDRSDVPAGDGEPAEGAGHGEPAGTGVAGPGHGDPAASGPGGSGTPGVAVPPVEGQEAGGGATAPEADDGGAGGAAPGSAGGVPADPGRHDAASAPGPGPQPPGPRGAGGPRGPGRDRDPGLGGPPGGPGQGPPLGRMADHLGLQGEVRERFIDLQRRFVRERLAVQARGRALTVRMHRELASEDPDPGRVEELIAQRAELWVEHERLTARTILETRDLLDAEQQRRYLGILRRLMEGGGPREGAVGDRPPAPRRRFGRPPAAGPEPPG